MPRRPKRTTYGVVPAADRLSPAGRPRSGPRGLAVRELPRLTIRAERAVIRRWLALVDTNDRPGHDVFRVLVADAIDALPADRRADVERRARALARADAAEDE